MKSLLYKARKHHTTISRGENLSAELAEIDPNMGFAQMSKTQSAELMNTKFEKSPVGSFLSHQTSFTESNFSVEGYLSAAPRNNLHIESIPCYTIFPLCDEDSMITPQELSNAEQALLSSLIGDEENVNAIERSTRDQSKSDK